METCKEKILAIIQQKSLPFEEIDLWEETVKNIPESLCPDVLWFLENTLNGVQILTNNIKEKLAAIKSGDMVKWDEILKKESGFLETLAVNNK